MNQAANDPCREILSGLGKDSYTFSGEPVRVSKEGYRSLMEDMVREARRLAGIQSIYMDEITFGHSISQIKLLVVYEDTADESNLKFDEVIRVIGTRNILDEQYLSLDGRLLENISKIDCLLQPQWVMGRKIPFQQPGTSEIRFFNISRVLDLLAAGFLEDFYNWEVLRVVRTRDALWRLKRLRRLLDLTKVILRKEHTPRWDACMEAVYKMCDDWFDLGIERYRMLMESLREGFCIILDLIRELASYFERAQVVNLKMEADASAPQGVLVTERAVTVFVDNWEPATALQKMLDYHRQFNQFITVLPVSFSMQLYEYAKLNSAFSRYIKSCFGSEGISGNMERTYISWERSKLLDHYLSFKTRLGLPLDDNEILFFCNMREGSTLAKAASVMSSQKNRARLKRLQRIFHGEEDIDGGFGA
ncbi:MAG: hypothetical protein ABIH23_32435 [bacterium]